MVEAVREMGIIPFFTCHIPGYSIQEMTAPGCWFGGDDDPLGPWDWKIDCVRSGDIAYGKFLCGGKAAFATVKWYKELMNIRRATLEPDANGKKILGFLQENGSISIREVRNLLGVKKSAADAAIGRLQHQCRVVTGDITRVYRGPSLKYSGWQVSSFCTPEDLFGSDAAFTLFPGFPSSLAKDRLRTSNSPEESLEALATHILSVLPSNAQMPDILKVLR